MNSHNVRTEHPMISGKLKLLGLMYPFDKIALSESQMN